MLETAAGSGVVTRALAPRLGADARYMVTDLNQPMLDYAATRLAADDRIEWRQADALDLPFEDASFDRRLLPVRRDVLSRPGRGLREARRVLRPGGRFVFSVWDRIEENVFADDVTNAVAAMFPHDPPRFLARTPHGYHDSALIREELSAAGFADIDDRDGATRVARPRHATSPPPIARERRCATKSRRATRAGWSRHRPCRSRGSPAGTEAARWPARFRRM